MKKVLSILLIAAAAFGFYGGAVSINDVLDSKAYWEEEGKKTTKDLNTLEDGLDQLKANTAAYKDGLKTYNDGLITLANGEKEYAAGKETLAAKEKEYNAGVAQLADVEKQYGGSGAPVLAGIYNSLNAMMAAKGSEVKASQIVASEAVSEADALALYKTIQAIVNENIGPTGEGDFTVAIDIAAGIVGEESSTIAAGFGAVSDFVSSYGELGINPKNASFIIAAAGVYGGMQSPPISADEVLEGYGSQMIQAVGIDGSEDDILEVLSEDMKQPAVKDIVKANAGKTLTAYNLVLLVYSENDVKTAANTIAALREGEDPEKDAESYTLLYNTMSTLVAGVDLNGAAEIAKKSTGKKKEVILEGYNGYITYVNGKKQISEATPLLEAGRKELAAAEVQLADGRAQLADGKKQLDQYRDGEKTLREGLATLMGTKADPGLKSIAARVGEKETFTGVDGFFNFDAGYKGLKAGRAYQDDSGVVITKELTSRAVGLGVGIGAGVVALLAAILGLLKKNKGAAVVGLIAAAAAGFGAYYVNAAGTFYSEGAGSTVGNLPMIAMCVLAGVAAIFAIANFAAPKAEVEAKKEA